MKNNTENYEIISTMENGYSIVKNDFDFHGVLNHNGEIVLDFIYTNILYFECCKYFVFNEYEWFFIDTQSSTKYQLCETKINEESVLSFKFVNESLIKIEIQKTWEEDEEYFDKDDNEYYYNTVTAQKKIYGFIDNLGISILAIEFDYIGEFFNGIAKIQKDKNWGVINEKGKIIIPVEFNSLEFIDNNKIKAIKYILYNELSSRVCGIYDYSGKVVIPFIFSSIRTYKNGKAIATDLDGNRGIIDLIGNKLVDETVILSNGIIKEKKFSKWGLNNKDNNTILPHEYDDISDFVNRKAKVIKNGKFGYINDEFIFTIPCELEQIEEFTNGKAKAKKNNFWGFIDESGNTLIPFEFDEIDQFIERSSKARKGWLWGIIEETGNTKIPFEYDEISYFENGKAKANKNGNWGYINENGNVLIPFKYKNIDALENDFFKVKKDNKWGCINPKSELFIPYLYDSIETANNNLLIVSRGYHFETQIFSDYDQISTKNYRYQIVFGCIDYDGKTLIPLEFEELYVNNLNYIRAVKNNKWGVIDCRGVELISFEFDFIGEFENSIYLVGKKYYEDIKFPHGNRIKYGCIDSDERIIVPIEYEEIGKFNGNGVAKAKKNEKYGLINKNGNVIAPFEYDEMKEFIDGKIIVKKDYSSEINWEKLNFGWKSFEDYQKDDFSLWGVLEETGRVLYPIEYDEIKEIENDKIEAIKNGRLEFIMKNILNKDEKSISNNKENTNENNSTNSKSIKKRSNLFPEVNGQSINSQIHITDKLIMSRLNDKWGLTNHNGEIILPHQFKKIGKLTNGMFKVTSNGFNFGYVDEKGNTIVPVEYARLGKFINGKALACKSNNGKMKYGCINDKGKVIIPFEYEKLSYFTNGLAIAQRKWDMLIIDEQNNEVKIKDTIQFQFEYTTREKDFDGLIEYEKHYTVIQINITPENSWEYYFIEDGEKNIIYNYQLLKYKGVSLDNWGSEVLEVRNIDFDDPVYFGDSEDHSFSNNGLRDSFNELTQGALGDFDKWHKDGGDLTTLNAELGY